MLFTFIRDKDGNESVYLGEECVAHLFAVGEERRWGWSVKSPESVKPQHVNTAIIVAEESGFWDYNSGDIMRARQQIQAGDYCAEELFGVGGWSNVINEVTVDVPAVDGAILTVETEEG